MERDGNQSDARSGDAKDNDLRFVRQSLPDAMTGLVQRILHPDQYHPFEEEVSNDTLLGYNKNDRPRTLSDIQRDSPSHWWLSFNTQKKHNYSDIWMYIRNAAFLKEMRHAKTFHEQLLPVQSCGFFDVWVVCRRFGTLYESFRHWTVLTQGHMFHLRATKETIQNMEVQSGLGSDNFCNVSLFKKLLMKQGISTPIHYEHIDFTPMLGEDSEGDKNKHKYIAYHVGQTVYNWEEINLLAEATLEQMLLHDIGSYDMFGNNCQHFALSLVRRIVSTQRRHIAIGGSRRHLAQWSIGIPGLELTPWLTKTKARLLLLPTSTTKRIPIFNMFLTTGALATLHYANTIPALIDKLHFRKTWRKELRGLIDTDEPLNYLKEQFREHVSDKLTWKNYGDSIWGWFGAVSVLNLAAEHAQSWGATVLTSAVSASIPASKATILAASLPYEAILSSGIVCYWIITRTFFGRGSLTIRHMDIRSVPPPAYSFADPFPGTDEDNPPPLPPRRLDKNGDAPPLPPRKFDKEDAPPLPPRKGQ